MRKLTRTWLFDQTGDFKRNQFGGTRWLPDRKIKAAFFVMFRKTREYVVFLEFLVVCSRRGDFSDLDATSVFTGAVRGNDPTI